MIINILVVDDNHNIREGIKNILRLNPQLNIIGESENGVEALSFLENNNNIDIILMDISMPIMNGIEATKIITKKFPTIKVIAFTMHKQDSYIESMKEAGAMSYLLKTSDIEDIFQAINDAMKGKKSFKNLD